MKGLRSDNLMLAAASQLPFQDEWRQLANDLPGGSVLFVVPVDETSMTCAMQKVASALRRQGRRVAAIQAANPE